MFRIIQGQTLNSVVDINAEYVWDVCWNRIVTLFRVPLPCNWVVSTALDFFHRYPLLVQEAQAFPAVTVPNAAVAAAARSARIAVEDIAFADAVQTVPMQQRRQEVEESAEAQSVSLQFTDDAAQAVATAIAAVAGPAAMQVVAFAADHEPEEQHRAAAAPVASRRRLVVAEIPVPAHELLLQAAPLDIALNPLWPAPKNLWMPGATQCAFCCRTCRIGAWQSSHRGMLNHYRAIHNSVFQLPLKEANVSGEANVIVAESSWCIRGTDGDGNASSDKRSSWIPCKRQKSQ